MSFEKIFKQKYILASKSPRRIKLLQQIGLDFISIDTGVKELDIKEFQPLNIILTNSKMKAFSVPIIDLTSIIIAADTIVAIDKKILHKPASKKEAFEYLKMLSGKEHKVYTGIYVANRKNEKEHFGYEKTKVFFRELADSEINYYIKYHNPLDKAGSYGIQDDFGCLFVEKIIGDYYNVVGLPLVKLYEMLLKII